MAFDFFQCGRVHFLGIGGVSLSLLARFLHASGIAVSGTDKSPGAVLLSLEEAGIPVWTGFEPEKTGRPDAVVYSSAIPENDPEYLYLSSCGIPLFERFELLGAVSEKFRCNISVAGTHGKTTTTAMISKALFDAGKKIFSHVGGSCVDLGEFLYTGRDYFVCEACEYRKSLLALHPDIAIVLNAEMDHPDTYSGLSDVYDTFDQFLLNAHKNSLVIINGDDPYCACRCKQHHPITFGFGAQNMFRITNIRETRGRFGCDIEYCGGVLYSFDLRIVGRHNLMNAAACSVVCALLHLPCHTVEEALSSFNGVHRRFEYKGELSGVEVYSDYAHHPTEISVSLQTARLLQKKEGRLWAVFQPHTFSRTNALKEEFCEALLNCDRLIVLREYAARESAGCGMSAKALFSGIRHEKKFYFDNFIDAAALLVKETTPGDTIVVLGAGDIDILCMLLIDQSLTTNP